MPIMRVTRIVPPWLTAGILAAGALSSVALGQTAPAPAIPNVPSENLQEFRALPPQEAEDEVENEPERYLQTEVLSNARIKTYGWLAAGIGANNWGNPWNGTITFVDRN
mgnify:FL=1